MALASTPLPLWDEFRSSGNIDLYERPLIVSKAVSNYNTKCDLYYKLLLPKTFPGNSLKWLHAGTKGLSILFLLSTFIFSKKGTIFQNGSSKGTNHVPFLLFVFGPHFLFPSLQKYSTKQFCLSFRKIKELQKSENFRIIIFLLKHLGKWFNNVSHKGNRYSVNKQYIYMEAVNRL